MSPPYTDLPYLSGRRSLLPCWDSHGKGPGHAPIIISPVRIPLSSRLELPDRLNLLSFLCSMHVYVEWMEQWLNGWRVGGWMDEWKNGRMDNGGMDGWMDV